MVRGFGVRKLLSLYRADNRSGEKDDGWAIFIQATASYDWEGTLQPGSFSSSHYIFSSCGFTIFS